MEENSKKDCKIKLKVAKEWRKNFKKAIKDGKDPFKDIQSFVIPRESLEDVLALDTTYVRAYFGYNDDDKLNLIFVGAEWDAEKELYKDVFRKKDCGEEAKEEDVYDASHPSPPYGDPASPMN